MKNILLIILVPFFIYGCKPDTEQSVIGFENEGQGQKAQQVRTDQKIISGPLQNKLIQNQVTSTGKVTIPKTDLLSVHSKSSGIVSNMRYLPGDYVKKASLLFRVSNPELIEKQKILLELHEKRKYTKKTYDRKNQLFQSNAINKSEFEQAEESFNLIEVRYQGLVKELNAIGINTLDLIENSIFQQSLPVFSPVSGYVQEVLTNEGAWIEKADKLMVLANTQNVMLELDVLAQDVPLVNTGQKVVFNLPKRALDLNAEIVKMNPVLNTNIGTRTVYCKVNKDECRYILPGMFVNAKIMVDSQELRGLPKEAYVKEGLEYYIFKQDEEGYKKIHVENPVLIEDFLVLDYLPQDSFVIKGAYYLE